MFLFSSIFLFIEKSICTKNLGKLNVSTVIVSSFSTNSMNFFLYPRVPQMVVEHINKHIDFYILSYLILGHLSEWEETFRFVFLSTKVQKFEFEFETGHVLQLFCSSDDLHKIWRNVVSPFVLLSEWRKNKRKNRVFENQKFENASCVLWT